MFLAFKEMKHDKLRYGLIIVMIALISYLIFILTSLAIGLASENTQAINTWNPQKIVLNKNSNINIGQSEITKDQVSKIKINNKTDAYIGNTPAVVTNHKKAKESAQFIGLNNNQYIYKDMQLTAGHRAQNDHQVVVDTGFQNVGYHLGDQIHLNSSKETYKIVGFTKNAKLEVAPVIYGSLNTWHALSNLNTNLIGSAIVSKQNKFNTHNNQLHAYNTNTVTQNLPGYSAQNSTFEFMIGFLMIISLIVIAVFLYILTMQKLQNYAVLRAQGIPAHVLVNATLIQSLVLVILGIVIGGLGTAATMLIMPASVPMAFNLPIMSLTVVGLIAASILGALIPINMIIKIDPADAIGG